jgi:hypothetical protein
MLVCEKLLLKEACDFFTSTDELSPQFPRVSLTPNSRPRYNTVDQPPNSSPNLYSETVLAKLDTGAVLAELAKGSLRHIHAIIGGQIDERAL